MRPLFLDTVGLIAILDSSDQWHRAATDAWSKLTVVPPRYVSTPQVMLELANALARTELRGAVADLHDELAEHGNLLVPNAEESVAAWSAYRRGTAGAAGIVDCMSFEVMRRVGAADAFTNDRHFAAAGFTTLF
ncbi:MAG: type II toxin-antitoxin system VapC family toxin [Lacipirellulaceae bacterium]